MTGMSHWIMWEVNALFENMGTVQDGINTTFQTAACHRMRRMRKELAP
jgi:hypothetical protein